ncbi:MAG: tRNA (adenosine(37)-N6)-threonylcarbamoyltransferase complex ATPase subunit type 1 TsaE [Chlamydiales bacterium]|nr:tRNA (adenosine(37)-N6)-threonylcarbamoyltransferase complex ATPase subunit type 1 TsaE [Chlamydiales bacterium]
MKQSFISRSAEETFCIGQKIGSTLIHLHSTIGLFGDLGAGKTTLLKGMIHSAAGIDFQEICSPTFNYLNIYQGKLSSVYHFDLYRLLDATQFISAGFDDFFYLKGLCCLEWAEKIDPLLPKKTIRIYITHLNETQRQIAVMGLHA